MKPAIFVFFIGVFLLFTGCVENRLTIRPDSGDPTRTAGDFDLEEVIQVRYLGTGGYLFQRGDHALITAPLYSNPGYLRVGFGRIFPDTARIDQWHPRISPEAVEAILVGHAHYDHLLDVSYLACKYHPRAIVYGNLSVRRLVTAAEPALAARTIALGDEVARDRRPGRWFYLADSTIRFMAVESAHGPHSLGVHIMKGAVRRDLERVPRSAWRWREGETLAYLIDFLDSAGEIDFRIYYQDATSPDSAGLPPLFGPTDKHPIDLVILCVGSSHILPEYPEIPLRIMQPRVVILGHWENFFRAPGKPERPLLFSHIEDFVRDVERVVPDAEWVLPRPGAIYYFRIDE